MAFDPNDDLQRAIALIQAGKPDEARPLLEAIVTADPERELAWMWLATVSTDRAERIRFLQRVLTINPQNETARAAYTRLSGEPPASPPPPPPAEPAPGGFRPAALLLVIAVIAVVVTGVLVALYLQGEADSADQATPALTLAAPITLSPTLAVSLTPSSTPWPTATWGPSPTLVWDSGVPTWTPLPTDTPAPTQRVLTWTPRPPTAAPTEPPPSSSETPDVTATRPSDD